MGNGKEVPAGICHLCLAGTPGAGFLWEDKSLERVKMEFLFLFFVLFLSAFSGGLHGLASPC